MDVRRSNHCVYTINYHFVWCRQSEIDCSQIEDLRCPKYRNAILDRIETSLEQSIRTVADEYGYDILSWSERRSLSSSRDSKSLERLHLSADHVHLFLSAHPKHAPSEIVRTIKSITAREMWEQHESLLEREFWSGGFWEQSYYVGTTGEMSSRTVERYINRTEHV